MAPMFYSPYRWSHPRVVCCVCSVPMRISISLLSQRYNPHTDEWATVASLPIPRSGFGAAVMDNMLYLCGGCNNLSKVTHFTAVTCDPFFDGFT